MERIVAYKTSNGKIYESESEAKTNEAYFYFLQKTNIKLKPLSIESTIVLEVFEIISKCFPAAIDAMLDTIISSELENGVDTWLGDKYRNK